MGVPKSIALNLTVPELVTAFNVEEMAQLVARGPLEHPGARCVSVSGLLFIFVAVGGGHMSLSLLGVRTIFMVAALWLLWLL